MSGELIEIKKESSDKFIAFYRTDSLMDWCVTMPVSTYEDALRMARSVVMVEFAEIKVFKTSLPI